MFKKAQHLDTAFRLVRTFCVFFLAVCLVLTLFALFKSFKMAAAAQDRIYILAGGQALEAYGSERKENIPVEARDHIRRFHYNFFTLDPDEKVVTTNITRALYLADGSAKRQYDNLKESGYYTNLISGNISQQLETDSIEFTIDRYPYYFRFVGREKLIRSTSIVTRSLVTEGYLRNVTRSDNNPHGFLIERWAILENRDLKTEPR